VIICFSEKNNLKRFCFIAVIWLIRCFYGVLAALLFFHIFKINQNLYKPPSNPEDYAKT
jgi:hypothetical protein